MVSPVVSIGVRWTLSRRLAIEQSACIPISSPGTSLQPSVTAEVVPNRMMLYKFYNVNRLEVAL